MKTKVTFAIVNCNRLFYLKSCVESLLICTEDYEDKEFMIIDNASVEKGTKEYLDEKELQGFKILRQKERDYANEFAIALNWIVENATGDFICPLQGDMQFVVKGCWLDQYVKYCNKYEKHIGSIAFDAQRRVRIKNHAPFAIFNDSDLNEEFKFYIDLKRQPVQGAADVFYPRWILEKIYPWSIKNKSFEGGPDSETSMLQKVRHMFERGELSNICTVVPKIPVSAAICTDQRGTMGRVRGNKRYGDYWEAKEDNLYYKVLDYNEILKSQDINQGLPLPIEVMAEGLQWDVPMDEFGNWKKNPIRPETATPADYVELY